MSTILIATFLRVLIIGYALLMLNRISRIAFNPTKREIRDAIGSLPFIAVWPLAVFSKRGRTIMLKKAKEI